MTVLSECVSELNTLSVSHRTALKERALMEDRLLQAESALALANEKFIQLEGDVIALRKVVIDQSEQVSSVCRKTGGLLLPSKTAWRVAFRIFCRSSFVLIRVWLKFKLGY